MTDADWANPSARAVCAIGGDGVIVLLVNVWWEPLAFTVPALQGGRFSVLVDTAAAGVAAIGPAARIRLDGRSLMLLRRES
jgi:hypothetical protein